MAAAPTRIEELIVEVDDPRHLRESERQALLERCRRANMAIYASRTGDDPDKSIPLRLGAALGLHRLDANPGADADAVTALKVQSDARHAGYIPYTDRPLAWHTDGYYNAPDRQIRAMLLHCVHPAAAGGDNALLDHELVYCRVRDRDPDLIRALMDPQCLTIPANAAEEAGDATRPDRSGPVFSVAADGRLHMRYTHRTRHIRWRDDPLVAAAVTCLKDVLQDLGERCLQARLESGWGLVCNNVLHTRTGFADGPVARLLYRARYYDRIGET